MVNKKTSGQKAARKPFKVNLYIISFRQKNRKTVVIRT